MTMKKERIGDLAADTDSEMIDGIEIASGGRDVYLNKILQNKK